MSLSRQTSKTRNMLRQAILPEDVGEKSSISAQPQNFLYSLITDFISSFTRYYDSVVQISSSNYNSHRLLDQIDCPRKHLISVPSGLTSLQIVRSSERAAILLDGILNHDLDIQKTLTEIKSHLNRYSRLVIIGYNPYLSWLYRLASYFHLRQGEAPSTFITRSALENILKLSGFETIQIKNIGYLPLPLGRAGKLLNRILSIIPIIRHFSFAAVVVVRPIISSEHKPSLSIVIPCRNERGNIAAALERMPSFPANTEIIFVEGHSNDGTWEEIQRIAQRHQAQWEIKTVQQTGEGKVDAVRLGFSIAKNDLLTVLDADLTMPPELLPRFYEAYCQGSGDFINGCRLVYPMEGKAMRFLNLLGNIFFAKILSYILDSTISDSLCGTKLLSRKDYERMVRWRGDFGDFDPFGDFELLYPAAILRLGIVDIPIRYRARVYGTTNIKRFYHGLLLLRMTILGYFKVKLGGLGR